MNPQQKIPAEIIQRLTPSQALEYMMVPFSVEDGRLGCYASEERDHADALIEMEILYGLLVDVVAVPEADLEKLLRQYYRNDGQKPASTRSITEIGSGQGFLMALIEEAFDNYASDIHVECYE